MEIEESGVSDVLDENTVVSYKNASFRRGNYTERINMRRSILGRDTSK